MKNRLFHCDRPRRAALTAVPSILFLGLLGWALAACPSGSESGGSTDAEECELSALLFAPKEGEPIAEVDGDPILTVEELRERISEQSPFMQPRMQTEEGRRKLVDQLVQFELLALEAAREEVHLDPRVQQAIKRAMVGALVNTRLQDLGEDEEVTDEELRAYYEENITDFVQPERVRVAHIFFEADSSEAEGSPIERASRVLAEIRESGENPAGAFGVQARETSADQGSSSLGGDLRYKTYEQLSEEWGESVAEAAFALERVGTISEPVQGDKGVHLLRLIGRQRGRDRQLEDVRPQLVNRVQREKRNQRFEDFVASIGEREGLKIHEELLEKMAAADPAGDAADEQQANEGMPASTEPAEQSEDTEN